MIDVTKQIVRLLANNPQIQELVGTRYYARGKQGDVNKSYILYHPITFKTTQFGDRTDWYQVSVFCTDSVECNSIKDAVVNTFNRLHNVITGDGTVIKSCTLPSDMRPQSSYDEDSKMIGRHITIKLVFNDQNF